MNDPEPSVTSNKAIGQRGLISALIPALFMALGAATLAYVQWQLANKPEAKPARSPVNPPAVVENSDELPAKPEPTNPVKKEPAVSAGVLDQKKTLLTKLSSTVRPVEIRSTATTQRAIERLAELLETKRNLKLEVLSANSTVSQAQASQAKLDALAKKQAELKSELNKIALAPKPPREALSGFSPVAKPAKGVEYHFEVSDGRVAFIDLEKLLEFVKKDFQVRMRLSGSPRGIRSEVGPIGDFRLAYEIGAATDPISGATGFGLKSWEVIPVSDHRGETIEQLTQPLSQFQRVVRSLSPTQATVTMWVYPTGFDTFRQVRDILHAQGFMVAARPLPEGIPVRGSPSGSLSAGQ